MAQEQLTDRGLRTLRTDRRQEEVWDTVLPGFGVAVYGESPRKTFFVRYRIGGKHRRVKLGRYPVVTLSAARKRAKEMLAAVALGQDPAPRETKDDDPYTRTFEALANEILEVKAAETAENTRRERRRVVDRELLPRWRERPAGDIKRRDVVLLIDEIAGRAPVLANRVLQLINVIFNEGIRRGFPGVEANPAHLLEPRSENPRRRFLKLDEIVKVWRAAEPETLVSRSILRFALLTAQRIGAVQQLRWSDLEEDGTLWRTPAEVFKSRRDHLVPLSGEARAVLAYLPRWKDSPYVFPGPSGEPRAAMQAVLSSVRKRTGIPHWTIHDFRTTFRTHAVRAASPSHATDRAGLGIAPNIADAILGHREASLGFDRYTGEPERYLLAEKRDALSKWGAFVRAAIETP